MSTESNESPASTGADEQAILDVLVVRAQARLDGQLRDADALDSKALGVLGVDAAAIALLVATRDAVGSAWLLPTVLFGLAGILLLAVLWPRAFSTGPDARAFYERFGTSSRLTATRQMFSELLAALDRNEGQLPGKNSTFRRGVAVLVIAVLSAVIVTLVGPG